MKLRPSIAACIAVICSALSQAPAATVDFSNVDLATVSSASGQDFTYTVGAGPTTGTLNVRLVSGLLSSLTAGSSPDTTGLYAQQDSSDLTPVVLRFTLSTSQKFAISENETLTTLENNAFTLPSGAWTVISSSGATVGGSGSNVNFQGISDSPAPVAYSIQGTSSSFDFQITNTPGYPFYGSAISVNVGPFPAFFDGQAALGNGVFFLQFPSGNPFGYYAFLSDPDYIYHYDLGYEYVFDAADGQSGVYLYDFKSNDFFYTSPGFPFPYLYDFGLNSTVYYYPDPNNAGHYNTNGVRYFYVFSTGKIISK